MLLLQHHAGKIAYCQPASNCLLSLSRETRFNKPFFGGTTICQIVRMMIARSQRQSPIFQIENIRLQPQRDIVRRQCLSTETPAPAPIP